MTDTQSADQAAERIRLLCDLSRYDDAATLARRTVATDPGDAEVLCLLAQALLGTRDTEEALDAARRASSLAPDNEWPHRLACIALSALGRHGEALSAALESVRCGPFLWQTHARVAITSSAVGLTEQAETAALKVLELGPHECDAWCLAGRVASARGDKRLATARFTNALRIDPQSSQAHAGLANVQLKRQGPNSAGLAAAADGFATSVRVDPHDSSGREAFEVVLRVFLARAALFIYAACYVMFRAAQHSNSSAARFAPILILGAPAIFASRFVVKVSRDVRGHFLRTVRRGPVAAAALIALLAAATVVVGAFVPDDLRKQAAVMALILGLVARLLLFMDLRRKFPQFVKPLARWRGVLWVLVGALGVTGCLLLVAGYRTPDSIRVNIAAVVTLALGGALAFFLRRVRR